MKTALILIVVGLIGLSSQTGVDYSSNNYFANCVAPANGYASPITLLFTQCGPYDSFDMTLGDLQTTPSGDPTYQAYTDGKFMINGHSYKSTNVAIHRGAEHVLYNAGNVADLEIQIEMVDPNNNNNRANLAFLFYTTNKADPEGAERKRAMAKVNVIDTLSSSSWNLKFSAIQKAISQKLENDVYLNMYTYLGTQTNDATCTTPVTWYVYASPLYVDQTQLDSFKAAIQTDASAHFTPGTDFTNAKTPTKEVGVTKLCYTGYFQVRMDVNYGLWFAIGILLLYFIFTLSMDAKPIDDYDYKENGWTHHPIYSVYKVGNDIFTRKSRASLILVNIINHCMWISVWYRISSTRNDSVNIITYALPGLPIGWFFYYWFGFMLRKYYQEKLKYVEHVPQKDEDVEIHESFDNKAQFYIFIFYFMVFCAIWVGFGITVWNMNELQSYIDATPSNYWVASLFVALALDWLVFDIITAALAASSKGFLNFFKWKGFIYDDLCHRTYNVLRKKE